MAGSRIVESGWSSDGPGERVSAFPGFNGATATCCRHGNGNTDMLSNPDLRRYNTLRTGQETGAPGECPCACWADVTLNFGAVWGYVERIGAAAGLDLEQIGFYLGISMTFQALDSMTTALIHASLGRLPPLLAVLLIMAGVYTPVIIIAAVAALFSIGLFAGIALRQRAAAGTKRYLSSGDLQDIRRSP